jgi:hypothetical protein
MFLHVKCIAFCTFHTAITKFWWKKYVLVECVFATKNNSFFHITSASKRKYIVRPLYFFTCIWLAMSISVGFWKDTAKCFDIEPGSRHGLSLKILEFLLKLAFHFSIILTTFCSLIYWSAFALVTFAYMISSIVNGCIQCIILPVKFTCVYFLSCVLFSIYETHYSIKCL